VSGHHGFQFRELRVEGLGVKPATLPFGPGLNVLSGASDTGKSYVVDCFNFVLGGKQQPRPVPESEGYDRVSVSIEAADGTRYRIERPLAGGDLRLFDLSRDGEGLALGARHANGEDNVSGFLLRLSGLSGRRVRKNAQNKTQSLSFRNLVHLLLVDEEAIIRKGSPLHSGESTQKTAEASVFRLLLTGHDDSGLVESKKPVIARAELDAQGTLLDQLIGEFEADLARLTDRPKDLGEQLDRLDRAVTEGEEALRSLKRDYAEQDERRRGIWVQLSQVTGRRSEVEALLERFEVLDAQYQTDLDRLEAVAEAGGAFLLLEADRCPLCGAAAGDHTHDGFPADADVASLAAACRKEAAKIELLRGELIDTVNDLQNERQSLAAAVQELRAEYARAEADLAEALAPAVTQAQASHRVLMERWSAVKEAVGLHERLLGLRQRRLDIEEALADVGPAADLRPEMPRAALSAFAGHVKALLDGWRFPDAGSVWFDEREQDLVIGNRRRGSQGKGLRALSHSAFTLGLMNACLEAGHPHPGFVILDSPLLNFRPPKTGETDDADTNTDTDEKPLGEEVKQLFYANLAKTPVDRQIIVIENVDPAAALQDQMTSEIFTKAAVGRYGFFPQIADASGGNSAEPTS
jgi:tetratricopeptide (TPR) repeat protein